MKHVQTYRTISGSILAELHVDGDGMYWLKSVTGRNLGSYDSRRDITFEWPSGKIFAKGNTLGHAYPQQALAGLVRKPDAGRLP